MTAAFIALACALILWPRAGRTSRSRQPTAPTRRVGRSRASGGAHPGTTAARRLRWAAVLALGVLLVGALGPRTGLIVGVVAAAPTARLVGALAARRQPEQRDPQLSLALDLVACALLAGRTFDASLVLAAPAAGERCAVTLRHVAGLLRLGADPAEAWNTARGHPQLDSVAVAATRSATSGARLAETMTDLAAQSRSQDRAAAERRAHRVGVLAVAPLGLCFLPAFVVLGIAPVILGLAKSFTAGT